MISDQFANFLLLTALSVTYIGCIARMERLRLAVTSRRVPNFLGVWTFAGVLLLPPFLLVALVGAVYAASWPTFRRAGSSRWHHAYNAGTVALASVAASGVLHHTPAPVSIVASILAFTLLNIALTATAIIVSGQRQHLAMFRVPRLHAVELGSLALGALLGSAIAWHQPAGLLFVPCLLLYLHRASFRTETVQTEAFDTEAGLWREDAWRMQVADLVNQGRQMTVIVVDPTDRNHGWLISQALKDCLRPGDPRGRYGDGQVVAATFAGEPVCGRLMTERARQRLADLGVNGTVGCATAADLDMEELLIGAMSDAMSRRAALSVLD